MNHVIEAFEGGHLVTSDRGLGVVIDIRELHFANTCEIIRSQLANSEAVAAYPSYALVKDCEATRIVKAKVRTPRLSNDFVSLSLKFAAARVIVAHNVHVASHHRLNRSGRDLDYGGSNMRFRNRLAHVTKHLDVQCQSFFHQRQRLFSSFASRDTTWNVRSVGRKVGAGVFNDDRVFGHFILRLIPACFIMLFTIQSGRSRLGWPATVTQPR